MASLPIPIQPKSDNAAMNKWLNDITSYLGALQKQVSSQRSILTVYYANTPTLRGVVGQLVFVPDHPSGPSIIVWNGTQFDRFTAAGVL